MDKILLTAAFASPRLNYVCDFVFHHVLGIDITYQADPSLNVIRISHVTSGLFIDLPQSDLLNETGVFRVWLPKMEEQLNALKAADQTTWMERDLLGIIFFQISRYEEYLDLERDDHNRFPATNSILNSTDWLRHPVVDKIISQIGEKLASTFSISISDPKLKLLSTCDIDFPWYRQNLRFPWNLLKRDTSTNDPFDTYDEIIEFHNANNINLIFFFLTHGKSPYEKIGRYKRFALQELIQRIKSQAEVGVHPPYDSQHNETAMHRAIHDFKSLAGSHPQHARQHYLRIALPVTYRLLLQQNVQRDYTLGYADAVGFRAGTAYTFPWYDLPNETTTPLLLTPLIAMDVTLRHYMALTPEKTYETLVELKKNMQSTGGQFQLLWHNNNLSSQDGWDTYKDVYFEFLSTFHS